MKSLILPQIVRGVCFWETDHFGKTVRRLLNGYFVFFITVMCIGLLSGCVLKTKENKVCYKNACYLVELAISDEEKLRGLQHRDQLEKNRGMLFVLDNRMPQRFWMKETLIPLDMLWLDYDGQVLYIEHAAVPCEQDPCPSFGPDRTAFYVLEINAGQAAQLDLHVGDRVMIDLRNVK